MERYLNNHSSKDLVKAMSECGKTNTPADKCFQEDILTEFLHRNISIMQVTLWVVRLEGGDLN